VDKSIFSIETPDDSESGGYLLLVSRGMPFGGGGGTAVFVIDKIIIQSDPSGRAVLFEGAKKDGTVVACFPVGTAFVVAPRGQTKGMTALEYHQNEKAEADEIEKAMAPMAKVVPSAVGGGMYL